VRALQARGLTCVAESARAIIREHGGRPPLPRFAALMFDRDLAHFHAAEGPALLDRSLVDAWGTYRTAEGERLVRTHRYNPRALIAPPWREIYVQDAERDQTWHEAVASFELCARAYEDAGYRLVELPRAPVEDRADFVLALMASLSSARPGESRDPS
jgi:predicted ATPase